MPLANPAAERLARLTGTSNARQVIATATSTTRPIAMPSSRAVSVVTTQTPTRVPGNRAGNDQQQPVPVDVVVVVDQRQAGHQQRDHEQRPRHQRRLEQRGHRRRDEADAEADRRLDDGPDQDGRRDHGVRRRVHPVILSRSGGGPGSRG